jgi:Uma2 family endonuclease
MTLAANTAAAPAPLDALAPLRLPEAVLELSADGQVIAMPPTGGETSRRNSELVFDSSAGFRLPDGSVLSPDASLVQLERWQVLTPQQRRGFTALRRRMTSYQANGARLGWLLLPDEQAVDVWPAAGEPRRLEQPSVLDGSGEIPGLRLELAEIWAA